MSLKDKRILFLDSAQRFFFSNNTQSLINPLLVVLAEYTGKNAIKVNVCES